MTLPLSDDDDLLAAEYVLGVQDSETRALIEQRLRREPSLAAAVAAWELRLGGLNDGFAEVPAPDLLPRIEARLFPRDAPAPRRFGRLGWALGAASAAVLAVAVFVTVVPLGPPPPAALLATLTAASDLVYEVRGDGATLRVTRVSGSPAPAGQVHELWLIAAGAPPRSLGLLGDAPLQVPYTAPAAGWALAVSVEPAGGAPRGLPSGPVIATQLVAG